MSAPRFHVGSFPYRVRMASQTLLDEFGEPARGACLTDRSEIWLSFQSDTEQRIAVIRHELQHAWEHHIGAPADEEARCQRAATIAAQFDEDLSQVGRDAIARLHAEPWPYAGSSDDVDDEPAPRRRSADYTPQDWRTCGCCSADIATGSINRAEPIYVEETKEYQIDRWAECEACGSWTAWRETCTEGGLALGKVIAEPKPEVLRGERLRKFLLEKQDAATCA